MIIFGPLLVIVGIGFFCWLLFTLAVFALPFFVGLTIGIWAFHTGAGALGGIAVGLVAGGVTFGIGQLALAFVPWAWLRLLIILLYRRARHRRRLQRDAWNCPDGDAFAHLADHLRRHRRDRRQRHGVRPLHGNGRARTSRTGLGAGLTPSRRRGGLDQAFRMRAVLVVEHRNESGLASRLTDHRRVTGRRGGR